MTNREIAELLRSIAAAYIVRGEDRFRVMAYQRAAESVDHATSEVKDLWDDGKLKELAGVGSAIASHLDELFKTGRVKHFDEVKSGLPPAMFALLDIPGIGPKTAFRLCQELQLKEEKTAISQLEKAASGGLIRKIEGFGSESEKRILSGLKALKRGQTKEKRMLLPYAFALAKEVIEYLAECPAVIRADPLGSLRRMVATIGDIDIAASTKNPKDVIRHFINYSKIRRVLSRGEEALARVILQSGRQVDLRLQQPEAYGAMLQYFTGGKSHNIALREYALQKGFSLSEHGIKNLRDTDKKVKKYAAEEDFYRDLGLKWIPPELRENIGEIEAALRSAQGKPGGLPELVNSGDIKGDLHVHSNFPIETSHDEGENSPEEILAKAKDLGYEYLGFAEHNPSVSQHSKYKIIDILKRKQEVIEHLKYSRVNKIFVNPINGLEIDIKADGTLAVPEEGLVLLDYVIASIHSSFNLSREEMTARVLRALDHPKVRIFGHPTGRKISTREGYELDWEKIFAFCKRRNIWLEINAWPDRLDLPDTLVREAVKYGVKMIICTDAHAVSHLPLITYGVAVARRGWAEKEDIINVLGYNKFMEMIRKGGE